MIKLQFAINCCDRGSNSILGEHPVLARRLCSCQTLRPGVLSCFGEVVEVGFSSVALIGINDFVS